MFKKLFTVTAVLVAVGAMVGVANTNSVEAKKAEKVTICHRTNAVKNPYTMPTVSKRAVDGDGKNDHTHHTGPVASSMAVATTLKASQIKWGDIIPPFDDFPGYNWDAVGQSVYNNGCDYPLNPTPTAVISAKVTCDIPNKQAVVTFANSGNATGMATLNGDVVTVPASGNVVTVPTPVGGIQITVVIDDVTVYDQLLTCRTENGGGRVTPPTASTPPTTPATSTPPTTPTPAPGTAAASLPITAGDNTKAIAVVASAITTFAAVISLIVKTALLKQM